MINNLAAGLIVTVKDRATSVLGTIGKGFAGLKDAGNQLASGLTKIGSGLATISKGGLAIAGVFGFMAYQASAFEAQMSAVKSIMGNVTDAEFTALEKEIKRLGATTKYSATEAAEGAELLARAGFSAQEQISALGGVLNAAAAEGIDMATAANIIANNVRAFQLNADQATRVADVLAVTSAKTNTSMVQLGEGLKYVSSTAKGLNVSVEDTSMALGLLANVGLQGSVGGTALNTMLLSLSKLSDENKKKFNELGIQIQDSSGNMLPIVQIFENLSKGLEQIPGNLNQSAFLMDVFGIRGQKAASNLADAFKVMSVAGDDGTNAFDNLRRAITESGGAAERMAQERLNNLRGAFTLLGSAIEAVSIEFMAPLLNEATSSTLMLVDAVSALASGMQSVDDVLAGRYTPDLREGSAMTSQTAISIAELGAGLVLAARDISAFISRVNAAKDSLLAAFGGAGGEGGMIGVGRAIGVVGALAAVLGVLAMVAGTIVVPIVAALAFAWEGVVAVFGVFASFLPTILIGLVLLGGFVAATTKEGQSFGDRLIEVFTSVWDYASAFFTGFYEGFQVYFYPAFLIMIDQVTQFWDIVKPVFIAVNEAFGGTSSEAASLGENIGLAFGFIANAMMIPAYILTDVLAPAFKFFITNQLVPMIEALGMVARAFRGLLSGSMTFGEAFTTLMKGLAGVVMNTLFFPFKVVILGLLEAAAAIGAVSNQTLESVKAFMNIEPGTLLGRPLDGGAGEAAARATTEAHAAQKNALETGYKDPVTSLTGNLETTVKGCINNDLKVAGKNLSIAKSEHEFELSQRGGFSLNPFQQGPIIANGGLPAGTTG